MGLFKPPELGRHTIKVRLTNSHISALPSAGPARLQLLLPAKEVHQDE